jgi:uncharacterized repeat protein (TIGR01451 family)
MYATPPGPQPLRLPHFFTHWLVGLFVTLLLAFAGIGAHAAAPPAGTSISNQASAAYTDVSGVARTVTSNTVSTSVTQVASMTLVANGAQTATPGSVVYYPHTLTNTGNGSDTFSLAAASAATPFQLANVQIFVDNGSGAPTGPAITSTGALASGSAFNFIVTGTVPNTATSGQTNVITVTGTSGFSALVTQSNTDTTTVTGNAVVTLTKAISAASGAPGSGPYTYTLTYTNTGNSTATAVAITDVIPAGMSYVATSARWSVTGTTALSDAGATAGTAPNTLVSSYTAGSKTFLATLAQVAAGQSGTLSFQVNVLAGTTAGVQNNTATTSYNNGAGTTVTGTSNTVPFNVLQAAALSFTGDTVPGPAAPGSTVSFTNLVTNNGNSTDSFNITLSTGSFPAGTTFQLFKSDGVTPMVDTALDGIIDTGPLAPGASYNVILKATLPLNATNANAPFSVVKTATSVFNPGVSTTATDTLSAITAASMDLTNNAAIGAAGVLGSGAGPEVSALVTNSVNPGNTTVFTLVANNTGPSPDSYSLGASTVAGFGSTILPAGWTVTFKANVGNVCTTTGATITNTGSVAAGGSVMVCAVVTVPAGVAAGTSDLYFRTLSPTSGVSDTLHDAVTVNAVRSLSITPNGTGQTYPGGSYVYSHTLTNTGNVLEGNGTVSTITLPSANNQAGWTSVMYYDLNGSGGLDAADPLISGSLHAVLALGLAPGQSITVFNKVIAPSGAVPASVNATTITATSANGTNTYIVVAPAPSVATDSTTVIAGNLTLNKGQSLDVTCDGVADTTYGTGSLSAKPGECVLYQITVTNVGSADATAVVVSDATPSYTLLSTAPATSVGTIAAGAPLVGAAGTITATVGTLAPGQSAVLTFGVKINN